MTKLRAFLFDLLLAVAQSIAGFFMAKFVPKSHWPVKDFPGLVASILLVAGLVFVLWNTLRRVRTKELHAFDPVEYVQQVTEAADFLKKLMGDFQPIFSLTLGSGLGVLAEQIQVVGRIPYKFIPHFPTLTVEGHRGELIWGYLAGVPMIGLSGRKHFYEVANDPNAMRIVTFPVQVMASLGVDVYFSTNAAGGLDPSFLTGDLMVITDHIGLYMQDPLAGPYLDFGGNMPFQPQHDFYDKYLSSLFMQAAQDVHEGAHVSMGVLASRTGRTYETASESLMLLAQGVRAGGMSVIPEIIVAGNRKMKTVAVSIITNVVAKDGTNATSHTEVMAALNDPKTTNRLAAVFTRFFTLWKEANFD